MSDVIDIQVAKGLIYAVCQAFLAVDRADETGAGIPIRIDATILRRLAEERRASWFNRLHRSTVTSIGGVLTAIAGPHAVRRLLGQGFECTSQTGARRVTRG